MTWAILAVAIATLVTGVVSIIVFVKRGGTDRALAASATDTAVGTRAAVESTLVVATFTRDAVESNKATTEAAYALAQLEQRIAALNGLTEATIELRTLLRFVPNQIDVEEMQSCRAQMMAWRRHLPDDEMPYCDELAANETSVG